MQETQTFTRQQRIENGIEWISYFPHQRNAFPPILMQHGMWHGAWCWQTWQECFAEWGWESHAISLPGHGESPIQRPIRLCTLDYYLTFVRAAVDALPQPPILMGHSMGGALTQWYLRDIGNLPAAVLVAPWALYKGYWDCVAAFLKLDLWGCVLSNLIVRSEWVRNPERAGKALLNENSTMTPEELFTHLTPESLLVLVQHLRRWRVPETMITPILWLGAERDAFIPEPTTRRAATIYPTAEYLMLESSAHNIMMEHNYREIASRVDRWMKQTMTA